MATKTKKLGLSKAELKDAVRNTLVANNENFDKLDSSIETLDEETDRLQNNQITSTASGTEIVVEDSAEMESTLHISGNSEQDSRSGKNLYNVRDLKSSSSGMVVDDEDWIKVNRNNTSGSSTLWATYSTNLLNVLPSTKYKIVVEIKEVTGTGELYVVGGTATQFTEENKLNFSELNNGDVITLNTTTKADFTSIAVGTNASYRCAAGQSGSITFRISVLADTAITAETFEYEPYGVQPSPDYSADIRSVKSKSDNLFDTSKRPIAESGATFTSELETGVRATATSETGNACWIRYVLGDISQYIGKTVRFKTNFSASGANTPAFTAGICNSDGTNVKQLSTTAKTSGKEISFVIPELTSPQTYLQVAFYATLDVGNVKDQYADFTNIMVTVDKEIKNYQPYGYVPVEAKIEGKNLFDVNIAPATSSGSSNITVNGNVIRLTNTANPTPTSFKLWSIMDLTKYVGQTIRMKADFIINGNQQVQYLIGLCNQNGTSRTSKAISEVSGKEISFVVPELTDDKTYLAVWLYSSRGGANINSYVEYSNVMLTFAEQAEYEPYVSPKTISLPLGDIELRSTPDGTRDTFERVDGVWNVVSNIGSVVLDGVNNAFESKSSTQRNTIWMSTATYESNKDASIMSNRFKGATTLLYENDGIGVYTENNRIKCAFGLNSELTTLELANAWLTSNPTEVIYKTIEPTYTPITDEALIQALDELEQLILHKGYNRITVTGVNGVKAYLDLQYVKDIEKEINRIESKFDEKIQNIKKENDNLNAQINRLKANQIVGTASGTEIVVEDSANMESTLHISGNSEQDSRSGKNLLKLTQTTLTNNGVTVTTDELGTVKVNGTATDYSQIYFDSFQILENGDYTFSIILSQTQENAWVSIQESSDNSSWTNLVVINSQQLTKSEKVSLNTTKYYRIRVSADGGTIFSNSIIKMQLEKGAESTPYEPYGVQPSPDYPAEIRSVKSKSDNLFDKNRTDYLVLGLASDANKTVQITNNGIKYVFDKVVGSSIFASVVYAVKDLSNDVGKTIRMKANFAHSGNLKLCYRLGVCNADGSNRKQTTGDCLVSGGELSFIVPTLTGEQTHLCIWLYVNSGGTGSVGDYAEYTNIMVTLDSEIKNYQPYGYVPVEAKVEGKNLVSETTQGFIDSNGKFASASTNLISNFIEIKNGEMYSFSAYYPSGDRVTRPYHIALFDKDFNFITRITDNTYNTPISIPDGNAKYVRAWQDVASGDTQPHHLQFEYGSTVTPYTEYVSPKTISLPLSDMELRSTPDGTRDTFERVDGAWNVVSNIGSVVLDGSDDELWKTNSSHGSKTERYTSVKRDAKFGPLNRTGFLLSNHFPCIANNANYESVNYTCATIHPTNAEITIFDTRKLSLDDFESWLSSNPTEVIYHLATPTYTPITDTALTQALDELEQLILHKGYNRITVTGVNGVKAYLDLSYVKDINIVLDNIMTKLGGV